MRVAFVSPWFRSLAHLYGRELEEAGHQVLVATSDRHFEAGYGFCTEAMAAVRQTSRVRATSEILALRRAVTRFRPDVVVEDPFTDPRWLHMASSSPRVAAVHDPVPHDALHRASGARAATVRRQRSSADHFVCFSDLAARLLAARTRTPVSVVPLVSEMPDEWFGGVARSRRGFVLLGRLSHYKGNDLGLSAWLRLPVEVRRDNPLLAVVSEGDPAVLSTLRATPDVHLRVGRFSYRAVSPTIAAAHAVLLPYRAASQSGVQLMALQHGVQPVVAALPGLAEYQAPGGPVLPTDELDTWADALAELAQPGVSTSAGATARAHYEQLTDRRAIVAAWEQALNSVVGRAPLPVPRRSEEVPACASSR